MTDQPVTTPEGATSSQASTMTLPEPPAPPPPRRDPLPNRRGGWWRAVGIIAIAIALLVGGVFAGLALDDGSLVGRHQRDNRPRRDCSGGPAADTLPPSEEPAAEVAELLTPSVVQLESAFGLGPGCHLRRERAHPHRGSRGGERRAGDRAALRRHEARGRGNRCRRSLRCRRGRLRARRRGHPGRRAGIGRGAAGGPAAIAIGSPFGLEGTVTVGYISAVDRAVTSPAATPSR